MLLTSSFYSHF